jgi:hypothetical protein
MIVNLNKITKNVNIVNHHYESVSSLHIKHAEVVAPGGQIVVHHNRKITDDEDDDDSYNDDETS